MHSPQTTQLQLKLTTPKRSPESGNFQHLKKKINNWVHTAETSQKSENARADAYFGLQNVCLGGDPKPCLPGLHLPRDQRPVHTDNSFITPPCPPISQQPILHRVPIVTRITYLVACFHSGNNYTLHKSLTLLI